MQTCISRGAIVVLSIVAITPSPRVAEAQQNPIVGATSAPPPVATSPFGLSPYGPYSPYSAYGPYGGGYPYQSFNPSVQQLANPQQNPYSNVPGQGSQPGQFQLPLSQNGSGGSGGGGGGGSGGGGNGGGGGGGGSSNSAQGASFDVMQDQNSPLYKRYERLDPADQQIRPRVLTQIGRGRGIRRGFIEEAERLRATVEGEAAARLDAHYDFSRMMIGEHLVPPVIGEVHDVQQSGGDRVLYLTVGAYQIVRSARLVLRAPNWRDYLFIETAEPQTATTALAPRNFAEQQIFDQAYDDGIAKGIAEARSTFDDNMNRLERDYAGMERYHELARQGAVSLPVVQDARHAVRVAANGQRAFVGEQVVTLRIDPRFKAARKGAFR